VTEITIAAALETAIARLSAVGVDTPKMDARILLCHSADLEMANVIIDPYVVLGEKDLEKFEALVVRREKREPVSHLIGEREFWSLPFIVTADVLDPRPASETLIETALDHMRDCPEPLSILDLGTGSGCLLITVLSELPGASGVGIDCSEAALTIARQNAEKNSVDDRATFVSSSWGNAMSGSFDLILSNPPYIADPERDDLEPEVAIYEPASALFAGEDGLSAYREIAPEIYRLLTSNGIAAIECGRGQMASVIKILGDAGLQHIETRCDFDGVERCGVFGR
jgi:release factor glutamine methyltransferase